MDAARMRTTMADKERAKQVAHALDCRGQAVHSKSVYGPDPTEKS